MQKTGRTFNRYCNLMVQDHSDIPTQDLDIIASYLECSADELKNYKVQRSAILHKIVRKSSKKLF
ncbi:hypothetical protein [Aquimarina longa]|uniref:hypothetical protein n=1 Tax=Aquimarina longa TaxID=1080221 RepID=UPI0011DF776B|nr:hypothetical protein [Aquimarina longa]